MMLMLVNFYIKLFYFFFVTCLIIWYWLQAIFDLFKVTKAFFLMYVYCFMLDLNNGVHFHRLIQALQSPRLYFSSPAVTIPINEWSGDVLLKLRSVF